MKKFLILGTSLCMIMAFGSCKSSESAYKKAYEKAKQEELAQPQVSEPVEVAPVVTNPVVTTNDTQKNTDIGTIREEKVTMVSGNGLKAYSVVCGSFAVQANAESVKDRLEKENYNNVVIVKNEAADTFRVIVDSFDDKESAARARDAFKAKYPNDKDFQKAWLLYRIY